MNKKKAKEDKHNCKQNTKKAQGRSVHHPVEIPVEVLRPREVEKTIEVQERSVHHHVKMPVEVLRPHAAEKTIEVPKMHIQETSKTPEGMRTVVCTIVQSQVVF